MGVHVGLRRLAGGRKFSATSFGDAVAAVRDEDEAWAGVGTEIPEICPKLWRPFRSGYKIFRLWVSIVVHLASLAGGCLSFVSSLKMLY